MRSKTDPKTRKSRAILCTADITCVCKAIDVLKNVAMIEGCHAYNQQAGDLERFLASRVDACDGSKEQDSGKERNA